MNGTIYEEIKKNGDSKKKEKLKFMVTLLSTNLLVATICLSLFSSPSSPVPQKKSPRKIHPHFKMIVVPLTVLIDLDLSAPEIPVTLMNKDKKILIPKAYLHEKLISSSREIEIVPQFRIEIPEDQVMQISADGNEAMIALPELKIPEKVLKPSHKRESHYEVNL